MTIFFQTGAQQYSTDMSTWGEENIRAFALLMQSFATAQDIRFPAVMEGREVYCVARVAAIEFIHFTSAECALLGEALVSKPAAEK